MIRFISCCLVALCIGVISAPTGDLDPPGTPASTINLAEPRAPITAIPITIEESGSHFLTGNMTLNAGSSAHGIVVLVDDVTIDLNGFTLAAQDAASGSGVLSLAGSRTAVLNGTVMGWGGDGVGFEGVDGCTVRGIHAVNNAGAGIRVEDDFLITDCRATGNGQEGIRTGDRGVLRDCQAVESSLHNFRLGNEITGENLIADGNQSGAGIDGGDNLMLISCRSTRSAGLGIDVDFNSTLRDCQVADNASLGLFTQAGGLVESCSAEGNGSTGIGVSFGSSVRGCQSRVNGDDGFNLGQHSQAVNCVATFNDRHGFRLSSRSTALHCEAIGNGFDGEGVGFEFFSNCRIDSNHAVGNDIGFRTATLISGVTEDCVVIRNTASLNSVDNYDIDTAVNTVGAIFTSHGSVTSGNPWLNFSH